MKAIIGADALEHFEAAVRLFRRLRFRDPAVDAVHVVKPLHPMGLALSPEMGFSIAGDIAEAQKAAEEHGRLVLERAAAELRDGGPVETHLLSGHPADVLMHHAQATNADVIAMGSEGKGALGAIFFGSVTRSLATHAKQSLLIAKGEPAAEGPVRAVFAADHSEYGDRCATELLRLAPSGISAIDVLTVYSAGFFVPADDAGVMPAIPADITKQIEQDLEAKNEQVCAKLQAICKSCRSRVAQGDVTEVINGVMADTKADLLILGAQGHSAIERLVIGSVAFHQVAAEPHSLLILRAKDAS